MTEWRAIVGDIAAARSAPERLQRTRSGGGTLRLRVAGAWALEFQHIAPELIARINGYFGYAAVSRIQLVQAPLPGVRRPTPALPPLAPEAEARIAALASKIEDPELRARVVSLGRALERRAACSGKPAGSGRKGV